MGIGLIKRIMSALRHNEVALVVRAYVAGSPFFWLNSRDKLASTVTIPDTGQLKVTYTVQLTYPA